MSGCVLARGERVGEYEIDSVVSSGGVGTVYRAIGPDGEAVTLKVITCELAADPVIRQRFRREADVACRVTSPHLVRAIEAGEHEGQPYLVQELIRGGSLRERIAEGPLPIDALVRVCSDAVTGLEALHAAGLVHRNVKPTNILLDEDGGAHLSDFVFAKYSEGTALTNQGQAIGTMAYISPEQIRGEDVTPLSDVYSLGCVVFECAAGQPPFAKHRGMKMLWAHMQEPAPDLAALRPDVPKELSWAVAKALEKDPSDRPSSAATFGQLVRVTPVVAGLEPR